MARQQALDAEPVSFGRSAAGLDSDTLSLAASRKPGSDAIERQLSALGAAQVVVILNDGTAESAKPAAGPLAASIPVTSKSGGGGMGDAVMDLSKHFKISNTSTDTALAAAMKSHQEKSAGLKWYQKAKSPTDPTPPVRFFPHLGVMLGTADRQGVEAAQEPTRASRM